jgi:hypothetical protein
MNLTTQNILAKAIRIEHDSASDKVYLIFEIVDQKFKQSVVKDWSKNIDYELDGKNLVALSSTK